MKLSPDLQATRRRAELRRYQDWLAKKEPDDYRRSKNADRGGMFPAVCLLVGVVIVAAVVAAVVRQIT